MSWFENGASRIYFEVAGSGDPVLLLPGFSASTKDHAVLRDTLAKRYRVIAADLPGSGRSGPQPRSYHLGYYEEDATAFMALLHDAHAVPAHLVGHSDGGEVALMMAALSPSIARSVLTWGAAGAIHDPGGRIAEMFRNVVDDRGSDLRPYREYLVAAYGESIARATTQSFANVLDTIVAEGGDIMRSRANQITCAVLLMVGQQDFMISKAQIDELAANIRKAETIEVEAAGHGIHDERPEWLAATVTDWLARQ